MSEEIKMAKDATAKVADLGGAVLHQLMRENGGFSAKVLREMARRLPGFSTRQIRDILAASPDHCQISEVVRDYFLDGLVDACGFRGGSAPNHDAIANLLNIVPAKDRAKWLEALKLDCPWVAPGFDLEAWKAKKADDSRRALAFFEVFEKLDETVIWEFFGAVLAERDRDGMRGLLPLAERLADTCVSWGLPVPPDDFDLVGLATHCTA